MDIQVQSLIIYIDCTVYYRHCHRNNLFRVHVKTIKNERHFLVYTVPQNRTLVTLSYNFNKSISNINNF